MCVKLFTMRQSERAERDLIVLGLQSMLVQQGQLLAQEQGQSAGTAQLGLLD
jgi:hypothetical protein